VQKKNKKPSHKFVTISKVGAEKFVKYRTSNLKQFYDWITKEYEDYRFTNVYSNKGSDKGTQLLNFSKNNPPT
jgi:hypothetical protein